MTKPSPQLRAFLQLRTIGMVERASDARYIGFQGGLHLFTLDKDGSVVTVDLVTGVVGRLSV